MNKTGMIASFSLVCMSVGSAWAVDLTLFEQDFLRGKGKPDSYGESFVAQEHIGSDATGQKKLHCSIATAVERQGIRQNSL